MTLRNIQKNSLTVNTIVHYNFRNYWEIVYIPEYRNIWKVVKKWIIILYVTLKIILIIDWTLLTLVLTLIKIKSHNRLIPPSYYLFSYLIDTLNLFQRIWDVQNQRNQHLHLLLQMNNPNTSKLCNG